MHEKRRAKPAQYSVAQDAPEAHALVAAGSRQLILVAGVPAELVHAVWQAAERACKLWACDGEAPAQRWRTRVALQLCFRLVTLALQQPAGERAPTRRWQAQTSKG